MSQCEFMESAFGLESNCFNGPADLDTMVSTIQRVVRTIHRAHAEHTD